MNDELAMLFAKNFIQRRDVKAVQFANGNWSPDRELRSLDAAGPIGFQMHHLHQHLTSEATYGHYLLDADDQCRMFAFDIDLRKTGTYVPMTPYIDGMDEAEWEAQNAAVALGDPSVAADTSLRDAWTDRAHPARTWLKMQMGMLARKFTSAIQKETGLPTAAAYSGSKGIHVYGFTGPMQAAQVRAAAHYVIESMDEWELERGQSQYRYKLDDPQLGYRNFSVEVFPKQDSLEGKDLGNLMRLPLGRNHKNPADPCFFLDLTTPPGVMQPHPNPVQLLTEGNPYA